MMGERGGYITEIFPAIQGEGLFCGERHLFVRFGGCNLRCAYCDTPEGMERPEECLVYVSETPKRLRNPLSAEDLAGIVGEMCSTPGLNRALALTGGEPLLQAAFLAEFLPLNRRNGIQHLLETNGILHEELQKVVDFLDVVSTDIKIESATGQPPRYKDNLRFLEIATRKQTLVKVVVNAETCRDEIETVAGLVASVSPAIPLIIQPQTNTDGSAERSSRNVMDLHEAASMHLDTVRVIPQIHKFMKIK